VPRDWVVLDELEWSLHRPARPAEVGDHQRFDAELTGHISDLATVFRSVHHAPGPEFPVVAVHDLVSDNAVLSLIRSDAERLGNYHLDAPLHAAYEPDSCHLDGTKHVEVDMARSLGRRILGMTGASIMDASSRLRRR